jgi:hypothetical protein
VTVTADIGDLVKWCADYSNGATVLRVVGNRGYAVEASYPAGWSMTRPTTLDPVTQAILSGGPALSLKAGGPQVRTVIIPGGQEVDITPQAGASGIVLAEPSPEGIIIDALTYAASTLAMTYGDVPGAKPSAKSTAKAVADAYGDASCVAKMDAVIHNPHVSTPEAVGALFRSFADIAAGCLAGHWSGAYGLTGPTAAFAAGTLLWLADGLNGVINDSQAAVDSALYWNGYHITVRSAGGGGSPPTTAPPTQPPPTTAPPTQQICAQFALTSSSPTSGPAGGGTLIVIRGSGLSSVNSVAMNPVRAGSVNPTLHPNFSVVSDSEIDVTTPAGASGVTYEIDFFTPHCEYFSTNFPGIPLFTFK